MTHIFRAGDRVVYTPRGLTVVGTFRTRRGTLYATIDVPPVALDDDGERIVRLMSLRPYYEDPSAQQRRARHVVRRFKQGIRWFRLAGPDGVTFHVMQIDVDAGTAFGCKRKRKTIQVVPLHDLWPEQFPA